MSGIGRHLEQGLCAGGEQQIVEQPWVAHRQHVEFVRGGEDNVAVAGGEKFSFPRRQPAFPRLCLALRTVPVAAGNGEIPITCLMGSLSLWGVEQQKGLLHMASALSTLH
jgi:hypothetical protein